jgi:hypothetical protein
MFAGTAEAFTGGDLFMLHSKDRYLRPHPEMRDYTRDAMNLNQITFIITTLSI